MSESVNLCAERKYMRHFMRQTLKQRYISTHACVDSCVERTKNKRAEHKGRVVCLNSTHACIEVCIEMFKGTNLCAKLISYEPFPHLRQFAFIRG